MPTSRTITREAEVTTPLDLRVRVANGRVRINGGEGHVATVNVVITVLGGWKDPEDEDVEVVAEGIVFSDEGLFIESPDNDGPLRRRGLKLEYEIEVPRETRVDLTCANGPIGVSNLVGPVGMRVANRPRHHRGCGARHRAAAGEWPGKADTLRRRHRSVGSQRPAAHHGGGRTGDSGCN